MAKRKQRMNRSGNAIVSVFEFDETNLVGFKYKSFKPEDDKPSDNSKDEK